MPPSDRRDVPGLADERAGDLVPATLELLLRGAVDQGRDRDGGRRRRVSLRKIPGN